MRAECRRDADEIRQSHQGLRITLDLMTFGNEPKCSFCGKPQSKVRGLVAGPRDVAICNECVELCSEILVSEQSKDSPANHTSA